MDISQYLDKMTKIQNKLLEFIDDESNVEENFQSLSTIFIDHKIQNNVHDLKSIFHLLVKISNNHQLNPNFFNKIDQILTFFKSDITANFTNSDIFNIFKSSKRILLYLIENSILKFDEYIVKQMINSFKFIDYKYLQYFLPEIIPFKQQKWFPSSKRYGFKRDNWIADLNNPIPNDFYERRKKGENESEICQLIRKGSVKEFISYISKNNISLDSKIKSSIYETNSLLLKKQIEKKYDEYHYYNDNNNNNEDDDGIKLIEYAAFYGSIEIVNYLIMEKVELKPSLWLYAIHSRNAELIHLLEDNHILPEDDSYEQCLNESIKSHNNDITNYFLNNLLSQKDDVKFELETNQSIKHYNFALIQEKYINCSSYSNLVKYDYYTIVDILLKSKDFDINTMTIIDEKDNNSKKSLIYIAVENENPEMVKLLLQSDKLDVNCMNESTKLNFDNGDVFDDDNFKLQRRKETPIYLAIEKENLEIVKLLLENKNININILNSVVYKNINEDDNSDSDYTEAADTENYGERTYSKQVPIFLAVQKENLEIVKLLLSNKSIDLNVINYMKDQSIHETFGNDDYYNLTAIYLAVQKKNLEIIKLLLANETIDLNIINLSDKKDYEGGDCFLKKETPLYAAVDQGNLEIVKLLLTNKNIDLNVQCKYADYELEGNSWNKDKTEKKTSLELAFEKSNKKIIDLLKNYNK